ncbi:MAG TPA: potassium-transporting ATPase subunit KdpA [Solirubrobacteraceae bacterium]|nr:potassium-transporting ATPase subunit KdpA [Solirubrobacteraceae bacterium]
MTAFGWITIFGFVALLTALALPLGRYMAAVYTGGHTWLDPVLGPVERLLYRCFGADPEQGQDWKAYAKSLLWFSLAGWVLLYIILRTQTFWDFTGLNPLHYHSAPWNVTFNTTSSFLTNTNWQYYGGETTMSYFSQMAGLTVQNFVSAAVGMVVVVALIRGIASRSGKSLGNFWRDLVRTCLYILLPLSILVALTLIFQGSIQNFTTYLFAHGLTSGGAQHIAMGPVASQEAIKELGTNGGGFFNVNSAHPFENPTGFTNILEMLAVLVIPAGLVFMFGRMVGAPRQGYAIYGAMMLMFLGAVIVCYIAEAHGSPAQHAAHINTALTHGADGGNLEGKEQRFGIAGSALFDVVTTVTSCGAVNSAIESFTGIGGAIPFANLSASETIFGGVGTGLYSMLLYVLLAVFLGGLMVGRTPEYLGKKIEAREIKLVAVGLLLTPLAALFSTALAVASQAGRASISAVGKGPQGFSETLYAYLSQANNNGSAFAGYTGFVQPSAGNLGSHGVTFADLLGGFTMLFARYGPILFTLGVAGLLAGKRVSPPGLGTMRTDNPTFVILLIGVIILVGALTFFPALLLGPIVQGLTGHLY